MVGLDFLWSVSYIKPIPTHEKLFAVEIVAQKPPLILPGISYCVTLALGCVVRRFHDHTPGILAGAAPKKGIPGPFGTKTGTF